MKGRAMPIHVIIHYDNARGFDAPHLAVTYPGGGTSDVIAPMCREAFGERFALVARRQTFSFRFKDGSGLDGPWEPPGLERIVSSEYLRTDPASLEIWCTGRNAFVYGVEPRHPEPTSAPEVLAGLSFTDRIFIPETGGLSGFGAHVLADGRVLFGLYHPNAARVFVMGSFNDWQRPGHPEEDQARFLECQRYRGYFDAPNTWLVVTDRAAVGDKYKFCIQGGVPRDQKSRWQRYVTDPYARQLGPDFGRNNAVIVDPTTFVWHDEAWQTPDVSELVLYELSVYGLTEGDPDIHPEHRGRFAGIVERIEQGYFEQLGVNALALMPLAEVPSMQGPQSLGYNPSLFCAVERDFGTPDDLRRLIDRAHQHGLAVVLDQVFNHTSNGFNPLWRIILEHPAEEQIPHEGGLYFNGSTPWGNRVATEKVDVQNLLIDACKLLILEYHVDGFRFDATHRFWMDHRFLHRLAEEVTKVKPDTILIAENLPNESDLNRQGWNGYAQWCALFHDKLKALLREGPFEGHLPTADRLGDAFYFSKGVYASHTNNVINYTESHDEASLPFEVATNPVLNHLAAKDRKGRLGLFATLVALGQPMIYMGQEFNVERDRNYVTVAWPESLEAHEFWQWVRRVIHLRRRYPGLRMAGFDPAGDGRFRWILAPWEAANRGGGRKVLGWRASPNGFAHDNLVVLMNFEPYAVQVDVNFSVPGVWIKLADLDGVNDIPPAGTNSAWDPGAIRTSSGWFGGFVLPSSSGYLYKWEAS